MQYTEQKGLDTSKYVLYTYFRSSTSWRVRTVLNYKKLPYDCKFVHLVKDEQSNAEYLKLNPNGVKLLSYCVGSSSITYRKRRSPGWVNGNLWVSRISSSWVSTLTSWSNHQGPSERILWSHQLWNSSLSKPEIA